MKTRNFLTIGIMGLALTGFVLTGCHKDSTTPDTDYTAAEDEANATNVSNDSKNVSDAAMQSNQAEYGPQSHGGGGIKGLAAHCTVTWNDTASAITDTMYINFGPTPVLCNDYRHREGEIIVYWNKINGKHLIQAYFDSGSMVNMTFRNYAVGAAAANMVEINGTRNWTNNGGIITLSNVNNENWSFTANLNLTYLATNKTATWNSNRINTLIYDAGTAKWYYEITGTASGISQSGANYSITITSPLYHTALPLSLGGCPYIEYGNVSITRSNNNNIIYIAFGPLGACSNQATATINNTSYKFTMW